ncbi:MAG TPA: secretin N-terminal domain-containing protein [Candidatus Acidoferrales bacterium]|nr:secretin N-terminal domain-containing protein [Candidatus Acidoferrales bacterium]
MKTNIIFLWAAVLTAGALNTHAQSGAAAEGNATKPRAAVAVPASTTATTMPIAGPAPEAPEAATANATNATGLRLHFRGAPLESVLDYLSDAAGFIIVLDTQVHGSVDLWSDQPVSKDEAVDLLNSVLNKNGYAAIRDGRTLTIVDKNDAKTRNIPVKTGNDPDAIPDNDEIVTQIIPIRFVEARQLASDLSTFVSPQATIVANEAGNSIVVTDTQSNIKHLVQIIQAVDNSAEAETEIRVFRLQFANPTDVATELGNIFPTSGSGSNTQLPIRFGGGFGGGGPGGFFARMAAANAANSNSSGDRIKKATQVTAVADARIQAVIVTAPKDLMDQIAGMMHDLDVPSQRDQNVYVYHLNNGDPNQVEQVLQNTFGGNNSRSTSSTQQGALATRESAGATSAGNTTSALGSTGGSSMTSGSGLGGGSRLP